MGYPHITYFQLLGESYYFLESDMRVASLPHNHSRMAGVRALSLFHRRLQVHDLVLVTHGRALGADFSRGGCGVRIIGGHADANGDRVPYHTSIDDMEFIIEHAPKDHIIIMGPIRSSVRQHGHHGRARHVRAGLGR